MRTVLLIVFVSGLIGIGVGAIVRRLGWSRSWVFSAIGTLVVRAGVLIVFVSIAVVCFQREGWYILLGVLFSVLSLFGVVAYAAWGIAVLGGDRGRAWLGNNKVVMTALRLLSFKRRDST
jgi:hypothetical protein